MGYSVLRPLQLIPTLVSTPLIVSTVAVSIPSTWIPNGTSSALLCCDTLGGGVKLAFGTDPNTLWGIGLSPGQIFEIRDNGAMITGLKFVRVTTVDGRISFIPFQE